MNVAMFCPWVVMAPLGAPVVPEVYNTSETSVGRTASMRR